MQTKILAIVLMLTLALMAIAPIASVHSSGIPNPTTITYATIGGPDATGGTDPSWAYDTSSSTMIQQVYEPLFMYNMTNDNSYLPLLADWWYGYNGTGTPSYTYSVNNTAVSWGAVTPITDNSTNDAMIKADFGITVPSWSSQTWVFHIRPGVLWQDTSYGTVQPSDVVYSIQRGLLMNALTGVNWLMATPLLGVGNIAAWYNQTGTPTGTWDYNGTASLNPDSPGVSGMTSLGVAVKTCVEGNDSTGFVAFNLVAPYIPFMQILTQSWAMVTCQKWVTQHGGINTTIALTDNPNNYTEFLAYYSPTTSPLIAPSVIDVTYNPVTQTGFPMMGTGPYILADFNPDPHVGYQYYVANPHYWRAEAPAANVHIIVIEEWSNRKFQFLSTGSTQADLCDVPMSNAPELFYTQASKMLTADVLPGLIEKNVSELEADYLYFCYNTSAGSSYCPSIGTPSGLVLNSSLFADPYMRNAIIYLFNESQYLAEAWLGTAIQPTSYICNGILYYNSSVALRQCDLTTAIDDFKMAYGGTLATPGPVWKYGASFDIVYNAGNTERQEACAELSSELQEIDSGLIIGTPVAAPWADYLGVMFSHTAPVFIVGWLADYPDADDWAEPFMNAATGTYACLSQVIDYNSSLTYLGVPNVDMGVINQAWSTMTPHAAWGPMPFTDPLKTYVDQLNDTYVDNLITSAPTIANATLRQEIYNELMDIFYAEAGAVPLDQPIGKHFQRDWIHGWIGNYSNNPVAVGDYFYQLSKSPPTVSTPVYGINLNAVDSIANTTIVAPLLWNNLTNLLYLNGVPAAINYTVSATYENASGVGVPGIIWVTYGLKRWNPYNTSDYLFVTVGTYTLTPGESLPENVSWQEIGTAENGTWEVSFCAQPSGTAGGIVFPSNPTTLNVTTTTEVKSYQGANVIVNGTLVSTTPPVLGDIGSPSASPPFYTFGAFDGKVTGADVIMFIRILRGTAPAKYDYLGDMGSASATAPFYTFYKFDNTVNSADVIMFIRCLRGTAPAPYQGP